MEYYIDFQHLPKGGHRPLDEGEVVPIKSTDKEPLFIPEVGDFMSVDASLIGGHNFSSRIRSRVFHYLRSDGRDVCMVNIVVEDTDDDWGRLVKE